MEERPKRVELAWLSSESNQCAPNLGIPRVKAEGLTCFVRFGTDEFIDYCRGTGCEPYICLNSMSPLLGLQSWVLKRYSGYWDV